MKNTDMARSPPGPSSGEEWRAPTMDLVRLAQEENTVARDALFARYSDRVLDIVRIRLRAGNKLRRKEDSQDLMQQALMQALAGLGSFEMHDESSLIRWLSRVVENVILDRLQYYDAQKRDMEREVSPQATGPSDGRTRTFDPRAGERGPATELRHEEQHSIVRECLASLPERYREVILMRDYENAPWPEIVERLGPPNEQAARMLHVRAVAKLGEALRRRGVRETDASF